MIKIKLLPNTHKLLPNFLVQGEARLLWIDVTLWIWYLRAESIQRQQAATSCRGARGKTNRCKKSGCKPPNMSSEISERMPNAVFWRSNILQL